MSHSLKRMKTVALALLRERMETVHRLRETESERYAIVKDKETGEHYLRYSARHIDVAEGGEETWLEHLLPVEHDDVLAFIFEEQTYQYPEAFQRAYLRPVEGDELIWFDPSLLEEDTSIGEDLAEAIERLNQGSGDEESIRRFFAETEKKLSEFEKKHPPEDKRRPF